MVDIHEIHADGGLADQYFTGTGRGQRYGFKFHDIRGALGGDAYCLGLHGIPFFFDYFAITDGVR